MDKIILIALGNEDIIQKECFDHKTAGKWLENMLDANCKIISVRKVRMVD